MTTLSAGLATPLDASPAFDPGGASSFVFTIGGSFDAMIELQRQRPGETGWRGIAEYDEPNGSGDTIMVEETGDLFRAQMLAATGLPSVSLSFEA
jgi:hypothetical protein